MRLRLLLVGWASLALAACGDDGPSDRGTETSPSTSSTTGDGSPSSSTGPGSSTGANPSDDSTTAATTTDSDSSTSEDTTLGESSSSGSSGSDTGTSTGEGVTACEEGCVVEAACGMRWASEDECVIACEANLLKAGRFSPFCRQAWENVSECVGTLTCEEFVQWQTPTEFPYPCSDADVGLEIECEGQ